MLRHSYTYSLNPIKTLVSSGLGISFMYEAAALDRLTDGTLHTIPILGWNVTREFNFVFPLGSHWKQHSLSIFEEAIHVFENSG
jgi:hypothetical protein